MVAKELLIPAASSSSPATISAAFFGAIIAVDLS